MSSPISTLEENAMYNLAPNPSPDQWLGYAERSMQCLLGRLRQRRMYLILFSEPSTQHSPSPRLCGETNPPARFDNIRFSRCYCVNKGIQPLHRTSGSSFGACAFSNRSPTSYTDIFCQTDGLIPSTGLYYYSPCATTLPERHLRIAWLRAKIKNPSASVDIFNSSYNPEYDSDS